MTITICHEHITHTGSVLPAVQVSYTDADYWTPREVQHLLARCDSEESRRIVVRWARERGITHFPADLAGRRCPIID